MLLLVLLLFASCEPVLHEVECKILNKIHHEQYTTIDYVRTPSDNIVAVKTQHDEKYVLILYEIDKDNTIKQEVSKSFYEKHNIGDTAIFYYTVYRFRRYK